VKQTAIIILDVYQFRALLPDGGISRKTYSSGLKNTDYARSPDYLRNISQDLLEPNGRMGKSSELIHKPALHGLEQQKPCGQLKKGDGVMVVVKQSGDRIFI